MAERSTQDEQRVERTDDEQRVEREAGAAAREAGAIGGPDPDPAADPARRPVDEGGGGEAEGFEQAEQALRRSASHEQSSGSPERDRGEPEPDSDRTGAEYGDADEAAATEDAERYED